MTSKPMKNQQKIKILNSYQSNPMVHPLTCGNNSYHQNLVPIEENNEVILKCLDCNYTQFLDENFIKLLKENDRSFRKMIVWYKEMFEKYKNENKEEELCLTKPQT